MTVKNKKIIFLALFFGAALFILLGVVLWSEGYFKNDLEVIFFDVGQGDSILINTPEKKNILIDGGPDNTVVQKLGKHLPFYDREIDIMILTHPHDDHVFGLIEVLRRYEVKEIYYTGAVHTSPGYIVWLEEIKKEGAGLKIVEEPFDLTLGENLNFQFLFPLESFLNVRADNLNNTSIAGKLIYGGSAFLFVGDAEFEEEEELLAAGRDLKAQLLKVGHHGSKTSSSQRFLEAVRPEIAVISAGRQNEFGHPSYRAIRNLQKAGAEIYRTDEMGDIVIKSDGERMEIRNRN